MPSVNKNHVVKCIDGTFLVVLAAQPRRKGMDKIYSTSPSEVGFKLERDAAKLVIVSFLGMGQKHQ